MKPYNVQRRDDQIAAAIRAADRSPSGRDRLARLYREHPAAMREAAKGAGLDGLLRNVDRAAARGITWAELAAEDADRARYVLGTTETPEAATGEPERGPEPHSDDERAASWYAATTEPTGA